MKNVDFLSDKGIFVLFFIIPVSAFLGTDALLVSVLLLSIFGWTFSYPELKQNLLSFFQEQREMRILVISLFLFLTWSFAACFWSEQPTLSLSNFYKIIIFVLCLGVFGVRLLPAQQTIAIHAFYWACCLVLSLALVDVLSEGFLYKMTHPKVPVLEFSKYYKKMNVLLVFGTLSFFSVSTLRKLPLMGLLATLVFFFWDKGQEALKLAVYVMLLVGVFSFLCAEILKKWVPILLVLLFWMMPVLMWVLVKVSLSSELGIDSIDWPRISIWNKAIQLFLEHPLVGIGFEGWSALPASETNIEILKQGRILTVSHTHNLFLQWLTELGLIGYLFLSGIVFVWAKIIQTIEKKALFVGTLVVLSAVWVWMTVSFSGHSPWFLAWPLILTFLGKTFSGTIHRQTRV